MRRKLLTVRLQALNSHLPSLSERENWFYYIAKLPIAKLIFHSEKDGLRISF